MHSYHNMPYDKLIEVITKKQNDLFRIFIQEMLEIVKVTINYVKYKEFFFSFFIKNFKNKNFFLYKNLK